MSASLLRACNGLDTAIRGVCHAVLYITTLVLFLVLVINVFLRYAMGTSLSMAGELPELMFPWMVIAGVVLAAQHGSHISIVWLVEKFSPAGRHALALLNGLILIAGYGVLAWATVQLLPVVHHEHTNVLHVPGSLTYGCMLGGFVMLVVTSITQTLRLLVKGVSPADTPAHSTVAD